ncbi:MAG: LysM peptidoglycan-binding domain-containing protein [Candidatus Omnitrophota bacterium]
MKSLLIAVLIVSMLSVSGCAKRIEIVTVEKERVDQNLSQGNKGFFMGTPPPEDTPKERLKTRKVYQVTVELPEYMYKDWDKYKTDDKELWGNRGYICGGPKAGKEPTPQKRLKKIAPIELPNEESGVKEFEKDPKVTLPRESQREPVSYSTYIVQKNDTLGKISKKVYGTSVKWNVIYEANKDTLKNPDKIYPGQKLKIPQD